MNRRDILRCCLLPFAAIVKVPVKPKVVWHITDTYNWNAFFKNGILTSNQIRSMEKA